MFKKIMVPTDGSTFAAKAEDMAISLAKSFNATVVAVHVIDDKLIYPFEVLEDEGNTILNKVTKKGEKEDVKVQEVLLVGKPSHDMCKIAEKSGVDLIVIGSHGRTGLEKLLMGSVAESILKSVKVPVLVVK
jgi:nucleotide-binding universal stress UspA family protein